MHLYSSAFVADKGPDVSPLGGTGCGQSLRLCQIGAAVIADDGKTTRKSWRTTIEERSTALEIAVRGTAGSCIRMIAGSAENPRI